VVTKRIVILANSLKLGGRCVAGREVLPEGKKYRLGPWIRPVSDHGEGELFDFERQYADRRLLNVMDFADVNLTEPRNNLWQPENWGIASPSVWIDVTSRYERPETLEEQPAHLWYETGNRSDRISHVQLVASAPEQSLYIIRPENFRLRLYTDSWDGRLKRRWRCLFGYRSLEYDMALTDPELSLRYAAQMPDHGKAPVEIRLPSGDDLLVCVSLAGEFRGHHYKLVATVLERRT
jgi:hypothetical protein